MSNTKIILDKNYFTSEMTKSFLKDMGMACKTIELDLFTKLFNKYDLSFVADYEEVSGMIKKSMASWNRLDKGTELLKVTQFDSKCLFCEFGKTVKVYKRTCQHKQAPIPMNGVIHASQIAFFLTLKTIN
jgi:uncharacterized protein YaaW (UPF0174 family)